MKTVVGTINKSGIQDIADFLAKNHMRGANYFTQDMLKAWAFDAEVALADGKPATIEIKSLDSIDKVAHTFTIPKSGIDWQEVDTKMLTMKLKKETL